MTPTVAPRNAVDASNLTEPSPRLVLVALASQDDRAPNRLVQRLQSSGAVVYQTHGAYGCLRVATAVGPALIVLDRRLPRWLIDRLRAHPRTACCLIGWLDRSFGQVDGR